MIGAARGHASLLPQVEGADTHTGSLPLWRRLQPRRDISPEYDVGAEIVARETGEILLGKRLAGLGVDEVQVRSCTDMATCFNFPRYSFRKR